MTTREYIKTQIDTLPEDLVGKVIEFISFQKYNFGLFETDNNYLTPVSRLNNKDDKDDKIKDEPEIILIYEIYERELEKDLILKSAIEVAVDTGRISTSLLQAKLLVGYARAERIINTMEKMNIIGPPERSGQRKVLMTKREFTEMTIDEDKTGY